MKRRLVDYQSKCEAKKRIQFLEKGIANKIKKLDNYECGLCGKYCPPLLNKFLDKEEYTLEVHHIIPWRQIDDEELYWSFDNLISLCKNPCHKLVTGSEEDYEKQFKEKIENR